MVSPQSFTIADVGCDHAYVSIALIQREIVSRAIAMDVRKGPLEIARNNVLEAGLSDTIELRLSDGLEKLAPEEADVIIIAGMGGLLIEGILERGRDILSCNGKRPVLILQPQSDLQEVRIFLYEHAYHIVQEQMLVEEGKYYTVMKAEPVGVESELLKNDFSKEDWLYGRYNLMRKDAVLLEYLQKEREVLLGIEQKIQITIGQALKNQKEISESTRKRLHTVKEELQVNEMALKQYGVI